MIDPKKLELTLYAGSYTWRFIPVEGGSFEDSGHAPCAERRLTY